MLTGLLLLLGCPLNPEPPLGCDAKCDDLGEMFTVCADADGFLCDGQVAVDCIDQMDPYLECFEENFEPEECDELEEAGVKHDCRSGAEFASSCRSLNAFTYGAFETDEEREHYVAECEELDDFDAAVQAKDCELLCEMWGV